MSTGHDNCPPVPLSEGLATSVFCNGLAAATLGSLFEAHGCTAHAAHQGKVAAGCNSVFICGKPAARTGDPVDCGGTIAGCSGNVNIGDGATTAPSASELSARATKTVLLNRIEAKNRKEEQEAVGIALAAATTVCGIPKSTRELFAATLLTTVKEKSEDQKKKDEIIPYIPEIARRVASLHPAQGPTAWGHNSLAEQVERWLSGSASSSKDISEAPYLMKLGNVLKFLRAKTGYEELRENALSEAGGELLLKRLAATGKLPDERGKPAPFNFIDYDPELTVDGIRPVNEWDFWERVYFNSRVVKRPYEEIINRVTKYNGQIAALGSFSFRILGKGTVTRLNDYDFEIKLSESAIYLKDAFDFTDNKDYGYWSKEAKDYYLLEPKNPAVPVSDETFRDFRNRYNVGHDFYIFSEPAEGCAEVEQTIKASWYPE